MTTFERLEQTAHKQHIELYEYPLPVKGLYYADKDFAAITLSTLLKTDSGACVVLAHSSGTITPARLTCLKPQKTSSKNMSIRLTCGP